MHMFAGFMHSRCVVCAGVAGVCLCLSDTVHAVVVPLQPFENAFASKLFARFISLAAVDTPVKRVYGGCCVDIMSVQISYNLIRSSCVGKWYVPAPTAAQLCACMQMRVEH